MGIAFRYALVTDCAHRNDEDMCDTLNSTDVLVPFIAEHLHTSIFLFKA